MNALHHLGELGELDGESGGMRLLDAAEHHPDASTPGRRRPDVVELQGEVVVVVQRGHVPWRAEAVVHLVEAETSPVRQRHRAVVQRRHVVLIDTAHPTCEPSRNRLLRLPYRADHLRQRRLPDGLACPGNARQEHAVAVVALHRRQHAAEKVPRAGGEGHPYLGVVWERRRQRQRAALEHDGRHRVEGGANLPRRCRRSLLALVLDARDALRRDVGHLGHEPELGDLSRQRAWRVWDRVAAPHRSH
uniref:Predicted protein n=1 Tax=Hordeum vulgare subsp. vulgare TaxID=112509 RepID=F2D9S2_HORVV|nr:predicted protein [Hordeum vulgare subsp. vulgare]